eukprot:933673-Ditylum_brightwellii.AAC.1
MEVATIPILRCPHEDNGRGAGVEIPHKLPTAPTTTATMLTHNNQNNAHPQQPQQHSPTSSSLHFG